MASRTRTLRSTSWRSAFTRDDERRAMRKEVGDDPPPPIPHGFVVVEWTPGTTIHEFLIWTKLESRDTNAWHRAVVVGKLFHPKHVVGTHMMPSFEMGSGVSG